MSRDPTLDILKHAETIYEISGEVHEYAASRAKSLGLTNAGAFLATVTGALAHAYAESIVDGLGAEPTPEEVNAAIVSAINYLSATITAGALGIETSLSFDNPVH